jgi:hypothetical protein
MLSFDAWWEQVCNSIEKDLDRETIAYLGWAACEDEYDKVLRRYKKLLDIANQKIEELQKLVDEKV